MLERAKDTQKAINDLEKKFELLSKNISKFSDYYDSNNLKHH
jgi:hypothetical protein